MKKKNVSIEMNLWPVNWRRKRVGKVLANRINYQKVRYEFKYDSDIC